MIDFNAIDFGVTGRKEIELYFPKKEKKDDSSRVQESEDVHADNSSWETLD